MMILKDWDAWKSYITYFIEDIDDLNEIAKALIKSKLCTVVYNSDGFVFWEEKNTVRQGEIIIDRKGYESKANIVFPEGLDTNPYALEGAYQSALMRFGELRILSDLFLEPSSYIRGYLGVICFKQRENEILLYPQFKIYCNGVINLTFRMISSKEQCDLDGFIKNVIHLYRQNYDDIYLSPELIKLYARSTYYISESNPLKRYKSLGNISIIDKLVELKTEKYETSDFSFDVSQIALGLEDDGVEYNLDFVKQMIFSSIEYIINGNQKGFEFLIRGEKKNKIKIGNYWRGYNSIYILDFKEQPLASNGIITKYDAELKRIMGGIENVDPIKYFGDYFGPNHRKFDDYCVYMNKSQTLWVYSEKGLNFNNEFIDVNRGHLIYENQVFVESFLFFYLSHMKMEERSLMTSISYKSIFTERLRNVELDKISQSISQSGDLNDFFKYTSKEFEIDEIRKRTESNSKLRSEIVNENRNRNFRIFGWITTILFGIISSLSLSENIIHPIWQYFKLWSPINCNLEKLFMNAVTAIFVFLLIISVWHKTSGNKKNDE